MSAEISVSLRLAVNKSYLIHSENPGTFTVDMAGTTGTGGIQSIGTTYEALSMGDTGTAGYAYFRNTDATNYVELGVVVAATFYPFAKLKAGEAGVFRLGTNTPYALANTASISLQYYVLAN
jgi:hypothetical protein